MQNPEIFSAIGVRNHSTVHLRNVFSGINIQPSFGEPYPLAYTGADMTVVALLSALFASHRFAFTNTRFFRLSIVRDAVTTPVLLDLDKYIDWSDGALDWDMKISDLEGKSFAFTNAANPIRLLPWMSVGDYTAVRSMTPICDVSCVPMHLCAC